MSHYEDDFARHHMQAKHKRDFTQTTDAEAIKLLNEEVHSLRNNLAEMKEHFIANKEYIRHLEEELRKKN